MAAMLQAGCYCCIGRPSNSGGLILLTEMFNECPDRDVIVVGENDKKPNGEWAGRAAEPLAKQLAQELGRPVSWALPKNGKDARDVLRGGANDVD